MVSFVIFWEDEGVQKLVYYISKLLKDAETRYPRMKKVSYALIILSWWLWPYFHAYSITVLIDQPLKSIFQKLDNSKRIAKWVVELKEFDIHYHSWPSIKV